ncbi:hypothetical protein [Pseudorhodoferax sp. Leaf267]|uniref:hypothetical protein n=1 Tax=Pseudorhodoferax sp. Leaf267 TaxID=1736316 RepID=UPI000700EC65|nr:hypothetical protein [Pseudorhodoferax sp. Leaf267]KQP17834.1 hypothetical protein ASF43_08155 [Pseudorhodoferax sp. Leaf267]
MSRPDPTRHDMAWRGGLCIAIGLLVLLGPMFLGATPLRDLLAQSAIVGWFALVLGLAFTGQYLWHRRKAPPGQR